ncbi:hybrid sensor histidine kinase/response regulator [Ideonella sp. BN130291]|uniref:hybrid sensor histidine kinase/response regulator n=1 Tax=Ideonella sp. BN130291 TaxID=3112940 RepID=UPI002E2570A0|nr:ATP-binding protein [Ideonella sp. BN130291]
MSPSTSHRVLLVWVAAAMVLALVTGMLALYAVRSLQLAEQQLHTEAQAGAAVAAVQVADALQRLEDIVLHTQFAFEQFGPGLVERDPLARTREAGALPPYRFIAILNAAGDPTLTLPAGQPLPALHELAERLADARARPLHPWPVTLPGGERTLLRSQRLVYPDGTFAGAAVAALEPAVLERAINGSINDPLLAARLTDARGQDLLHRVWGHAPPPGRAVQVAAQQTVLPETLVLRVEADTAGLRAQWQRQLVLPVAAGVLVCLATLVVAALLLRGMRRELASELRAQTAAAQAEVRSRFLAHMSHEIRTPMNGVLSAVELLAAHGLTPEQARLLDIVRGSGQALLAIINDLLDASKIDAGKLQLEQQPFSLADLVEDVVALLAPLAQAKQVLLVQVLPPSLPARMVGDALRLRQVLTNLVGNAVKFTERGTVAVACEWEPAGEGAAVRLRVVDTGIGIAAADLQRLFVPFEQLDESVSRRFGGTGLGLAIAQRLVQLMGGHIEVCSEAGSGSQFVVALQLPLAPGPADAPSPAGLQAVVLAGERWSQASLLAHAAWAGVQTRVAADLEQALAQADQLQAERGTGPAPTLIVDADALGQPAERVLQRLRAHARRADPLHCVLLSSQPPVDPPGRGLRCLHRPARRRELATALHELAGLATAVEPAQRPPPLPALKARVLAAEDNPVNRMILGEFLAQLGCEVQLVEDGAAAVCHFEADRFDVVLMDCQMPLMDGFEATRRMRRLEREQPGRRHTPVIALTAYATVEDRQRCLEAGMDDHLGKPFSAQALAALLQHWLRR